MINVVIDTNVLVSGLISTHGYSARIINTLKEKQYIIYYSSEIMIEYRDVLYRERLGLNHKDVDDLLDIISLIGISIIPAASNVSLPDEDDRCFYDTAKSSGSYLVTGNIKHYPTEAFIMSPADFVVEFTDI